MSRADDIRAKAEAEANLAELEDSLTSGPKTPELKAEVRAARQAYREQREAEDAPEGTARPATIKASAGVKNSGGK